MSNNMPNEVVAIAMALSLYFSDNESNVLTIKRYNSPWSDKIYQVINKINL